MTAARMFHSTADVAGAHRPINRRPKSIKWPSTTNIRIAFTGRSRTTPRSLFQAFRWVTDRIFGWDLDARLDLLFLTRGIRKSFLEVAKASSAAGILRRRMK